MKKRILSMLLVIVLVLSMVPVSALAEGDWKIVSDREDDVLYIGGDSATLTLEDDAKKPITTGVSWWDVPTGLTQVRKDGATLEVSGNRQGQYEVTAEYAGDKRKITLTVYQRPAGLAIVDKTTNGAPASKLDKGATLELGYTYTNTDAIDSAWIDAKWSIQGDEGVLSVSGDGVVTAVGYGEATVKLVVNSVEATTKITVEPGKLTVTPYPANVYVNGFTTLTVKNGEALAEGATCEVTTGNSFVEVKNNNDGTFDVKGLQAGTATISFSMTDSEGKQYSGSRSVNVLDAKTMVIKRVDGTEFKVGNTVPMGAYESNESTIKLDGVKWSGNNDAVAVIDPITGALTCKTAGTVIITAKKADYADVTRSVTVEANDLKICNKVGHSSVTQIFENKEIELVVLDSTGKELTVKEWKSSNNAAATVVDGKLKGVSRKAGTSVDITATVEGFAEPAKLTVSVCSSNIEVTGGKMYVLGTLTLNPQINGNAATGVTVEMDTTASTGSVDISGYTITGKKAGTVVLKLTKGGYSGTCTVTVEKYPLTIKADGGKDSFYVGKTYQLAAYLPDGKTAEIKEWKSGNSSFAEIDSNGRMTVLVAGVGKTVTITATPKFHSFYTVPTLEVTILGNSLVITDTSGNEVSTVNVDETVDLVAKDGNGDTVTDVKWSSSDPQKAAFISGGRLKGIRQSSTPVTITATKEGYTAGTVDILVSLKSFDIKNDKDEIVTNVEMLAGTTMQLKAVGQDGEEQSVVWTSASSKVTVDNTGLVTAKESTLREAVAIEASLPGYETKTVKVTVIPTPVFSTVKLAGDDDRSDKLAVGETRKLIALDADGLEVEGVKWEALNERAVLENGELTGAEAGEVAVTATKEGYAPKNLVVNVYVQPVTGFDIASELPVADKNGYIPMEVGDELPLLIDNVQPSYASDSTAIEWVPSNSSDDGVAKVENGKLIAVTPGYVTLNARATNAATRSGDVIYQLKVHVLAEERIVLEEEVPEEVLAGKSVNLKASVVDAAGEPVPKTSVKWTMLSEEEGVRLLSDKLDTDSNMRYRHEIKLRAEAVGCEAEPLEVTVMVVPVTTGITLKVGEEKVNNEVFIVDLSDDYIAENGIIVSASVLPASATPKVRWEISDPGNVCTEEQLDTDLLLVPVSALKSGVVTVKAYAGDGTGVSATAKIQFSKLGAGDLKDAPKKLRGGASLDLKPYLVQDKDLDDKSVTWSLTETDPDTDGVIVKNGKSMKKGKVIATISKTGKLTTKPVTEPTPVTVKITGSNGEPATHTITLYPTAKSVKITCEDLKARNYTVELKKDKSERTFNFEAAIKPEVLQNENVWPLIWSSTNNDIATVDEDGQVVVKKAGKVRIDCMIADGSKIKGSVNLKVTSNANSVTVTPNGRTLASGNSLNMKAVIKTSTGRKAANQEVIWSITDELGNATSAAIISATGRVTAYDVDRLTEVLVTATSKQDKTVFGSVVLTIKPNTTKTLHAYIDGNMVSGTISMNLNDSNVLGAKWQKSGSGKETVAEDCQFFSSNTKVATVDEDLGTLTAVGYGTSTITLRCVDPATQNICTSTFTVKVVKKVGFVTISAPSLRDLRSGKSVTLKATAWNDYANGVKADNQGFTWEVTENGKETNVATINSSGVLTAKTVTKKHTVVVKAISKEGGIFATATFNIFPAETVKFYFALNDQEYTGTLPVDLDTGLGGLKVRIHTAFANGNGNITENDIDPAGVTWSTSDKNVIQITTAGPKALKVGKATLTAKYKIGNTTYESKTTAIVNRTMGSVKSIEQSSILVAGKSINLRAVPEYSNATNKNVLWSVEPDSYSDNVSINMYTGKLSAKKGIGGYDVTVTASPVDGSTPLSTTVEVFAATTEVEISDGTDVVNGTKVSATLSDGTMQFYAAAKPTEAYQTSFKWTSSDTSVAAVDGNGKVTIKKAGATTIKAIAQDGTGKYAKFTLRVTN